MRLSPSLSTQSIINTPPKAPAAISRPHSRSGHHLLSRLQEPGKSNKRHALYKRNVPSFRSPSISPPNKTSGGTYEILTPNYGAGFVYHAGIERGLHSCACVCIWGVPSSLPALPPGAQGWNQRPLRAKEKQGSHRQDTAITGKLVSNSSLPASVCFVCKGLNAEACQSQCSRQERSA